MKKFLMFAAVAAALFVQEANAQGDGVSANHTLNVTIPVIARLDLEASGGTTVSATFTDTNEAGDDISDPSSNTSLWLNYTSILPSGGAVTSRVVKVKLSTLISGVDVKVSAGTVASGAKGTTGTPGSVVTLSATDQDLITGIGSAYTVSGANKGHNLTYNFEANDTDFGSLRGSATAQTATVTYTLADI